MHPWTVKSKNGELGGVEVSEPTTAKGRATRDRIVEAACDLVFEGNVASLNLDDVELPVDDPPDDLLALDEALEELSRKHPQEAQLVKLRYFAGMTVEEAAQALGISARTAARSWIYARAWLYTRITESER